MVISDQSLNGIGCRSFPSGIFACKLCLKKYTGIDGNIHL